MGRSVSHIPGRIRFRIPDLRGSKTLACALQRGLEMREGVRCVEVRRASGSIIVHYDPRRTDVDALIAFLHGGEMDAQPEPRAEWFEGAEPGDPSGNLQDDPIARSVRQMAVVFGQAAFKVALQQVVQTGLSATYRAAFART